METVETQTDEQLLAAWQNAACRRSINLLLDRHVPMVNGMITRFGIDQNDTDDLTQDILVSDCGWKFWQTQSPLVCRSISPNHGYRVINFHRGLSYSPDGLRESCECAKRRSLCRICSGYLAASRVRLREGGINPIGRPWRIQFG